MDTFNTRRYEMLVRVRDFGLSHSDLFPPSEKGGEAFAQVTAAVAALSEHAAAQISGPGTTTREIARAALRNELDALGMTARALAIDRPGMDDHFWLPRRGGDQTLLSAGRAFLREAMPLEAEFVRHAMPADFLTQLKARIAKLEEAIQEQQSGRNRHVSAKVGIEEALASGIGAARRLDAIVRNRLRDDAMTKAVWTRARRVGYPGRRAKSEPAGSATSLASPAASPGVPSPAQSPASPAPAGST
jgi:hypothetical protein